MQHVFRDSTADKRRTYTDLLQKDKKGVMELQNNNIKIQKLQVKMYLNITSHRNFLKCLELQ